MRKEIIALVLLLASAQVGRAVTLHEAGTRLAATECYCSDITFSVWLPNASDPVVYSNTVRSMATPADTLAPCNYLIEWSVPTPKGESSGFSSYYEGNHFRYREGSLQEYHFSDNPMPFAPRGYAAEGVQQKVQFADLLPQFIGRKFLQMDSDTAFVYKITERPGEVEIRGVERKHGYDGTEYQYILDAETLLPRKIEFTNNPGQIGEQILSIEYSPVQGDCDCTPLSETYLIERFPEEFAKFRHDSFTLESLPGKRMPSFTAPSPGNDRFVYNSGDDFAAPTVIAVLDASVASTPSVIESLRSALDALPGTANLIMAFIGKDAEEAREMAGRIRPGETLLVSARSLARDCGVADTPSIIICRRDGTVSDVVIGHNNELRSVVIQKTALTF